LPFQSSSQSPFSPGDPSKGFKKYLKGFRKEIQEKILLKRNSLPSFSRRPFFGEDFVIDNPTPSYHNVINFWEVFYGEKNIF